VETGPPGPDGAYGDLNITGNRCPRGAAYAQEEIRAPKRVVTATCGIIERYSPTSVEDPQKRTAEMPLPGRQKQDVKRIPVKSSFPCPKEKIAALLEDIYRLRLSLPVKSGDVVISDWQGTGIDVVAVRSVG
jgi:CxxC motif-containing protein